MNLETRLKRELQAEAARLEPPADRFEAVVRKGRRRQIVSAVGTVALVLVLIAGVGLLGRAVVSPDPGEVARDPGPGPGPTAPEAPTPTTGTSPTTTPPTTAARGAMGTSVGLLIAGPEGITAEVDGGSHPVYDLATQVAYDDLDGGVVFQLQVSSPTTILWLPAGATSPGELVVPSGDERLELHGVEMIGGSPQVIYTSRSGTTPEDTAETLRLHDLATGESREVARVGGWESGPSQVSYGGGRFLLTMAAEGSSWFELLSEDGTALEVPANPKPEDGDAFPYVTAGALSPDGSLMAYLAADAYEGPYRLVVHDVAGGREVASAELGPGGDTVPYARTSFDGRLAVASLQFRSPGFDSWMLDLGADGRPERLSTTGLVTLLRSSPEAGEAPGPQAGCPPEPLPDQPGLPDRVAETRRQIAEAAACDLGELVALALAGRDTFTYSFGGSNPPAPEELKQAWSEGNEPELIGRLLRLPHAAQETQLEPDVPTTIYVWPSAFAEGATEADWAALEGLYGPEELERMREWGGYLGLRVGISAEGDWIFAVAGD